MASVLFEDYEFPSELYNVETKEFTTPVKTLLQFAPHILEQLPRPSKDQEPIQPEQTNSFFSGTREARYASPPSPTHHNIPNPTSESYFSANTAKALMAESFRFGMSMVGSYLDAQFHKSGREEIRERRRLHKRKLEKKQLQREKEEQQEKMQQHQQDVKKETTTDKSENTMEEKSSSSDLTKTMVMTAGALSALTLSLYSTYRTSSLVGEISFHAQLELLLTHVETILQSTRYWITERESLGAHVPEVVRKDVNRLESIIDLIQRLDPRHEKKLEAVGWGMGAIGSLGAVGGIVVGSATILTGGAFLIVGGLTVGAVAKGQFSSRTHVSVRDLLESQTRDLIEKIDRDKERKEQLSILQLQELPQEMGDESLASKEEDPKNFVEDYVYVKREDSHEKNIGKNPASKYIQKEIPLV